MKLSAREKLMGKREERICRGLSSNTAEEAIA